MREKKLLIRAGFLILFLVFVIILSVVWIVSSGGSSIPREANVIADIYQDGNLIESISLSDVEEPYTFTVTGDLGCMNEIEVRPGSIGIITASCPDKICVNQGFIDSSLLPITCLPNHLVIQIRTEELTTDVVTY